MIRFLLNVFDKNSLAFMVFFVCGFPFSSVCLAADIIPLPFLPAAINNSGIVIGGGYSPAYTWQNGVSSLLPRLAADPTRAVDINDAGRIIGVSGSFLNGAPHAVSWQNGTITDLGGSWASWADAINSNGVILGSDYYLGSVLYQNGTTTQIVLPPSYLFGSDIQGQDINDFGQVVSWKQMQNCCYHRGPALWQNNNVSTIPPSLNLALDNYNLPTYGSYLKINNSGQIIGTFISATDNLWHSFLWQGNSVVDITPVYAAPFLAYGINNLGQIVGHASPGQYAALWQNGSFTNLNSLAGVGSSGWNLASAIAINDKSQIVGIGVLGGYQRYFLLNAPELVSTKSDSVTPQDPMLVASNLSASEPTEPSCLGMCAANAHTMQASLNLTDTPVGYRPPYGPAAYIRLSYHHLTSSQAASPNFFNVGPKWTLNLLSYVQDDPATPGANVLRYVAGGGAIDYNAEAGGFDSATGAWLPERKTQAILTRIPASGSVTRYELIFPDGAKQIFSRVIAGNPRRTLLTQIVDPAGLAINYTYDAQNRLTQIADATGRLTTFSYTNTNPLLVTKITDPFGRFADLTYTNGKLTEIKDVLGIKSSFVYDTTDTTLIKTLTTPYGNSNFQSGVTGASNSRWLELTDPLNNTERLEIAANAPGILSTPSPIPSGINIESGTFSLYNTFHWDKQSYPQAITKSGGVITAKDYTRSNISHWLSDARGQTLPILGATKLPSENYVFYNYPRQAQGSKPGSLDKPSTIGRVLDDGSSQITKLTYNSLGMPTVITSPIPDMGTTPADRTAIFTYSTSGIDLLKTWQKTSASTYSTTGTYTYNSQHLPLTYTGPDLRTWTYTYNAVGQRTSVRDPLGKVTTTAYDTRGRVTTITNANNVVVKEFHYPCDTSSTGLLNCNLPDWIKDYDGVDLVGYQRSFLYDKLDRVTKVTYPDGSTELYDYTFPATFPVVLSRGTQSLDLWKYTDRLGRITTYNYDQNRRKTSVTEPVTVDGVATTRTTQYEYYPNGALKSLIDGNGNVTRWVIDIQSRPISKTYGFGTANAKTETYTYETNSSRLKTITDPDGRTKTITYNKDDTEASYTYTVPASSGLPVTPNVAFTYDPYWPRLASMTDGSGPNGTTATTDFTYTPLGVDGALQMQNENNHGFYNHITGFFYDELGRLKQRWAAESQEWFLYDNLGRVSVYGTDLGVFNYAYQGQSGRVTSQSVTNGTVTTTRNWTYDTTANDRRLLSINNGPVSRSFTLSYANHPTVAGAKNPYQIAGITDTAPATHPWQSQSWAYGYDASDRLLSAVGSRVGTYQYNQDKADNVTRAQNAAGFTDFPSYDQLNRMTKFAWWQNFAADNAGNTLREFNENNITLRNYKWDFEGRLLEMTDPRNPGYRVFYTYDGKGRRLSVGVTNNGTTSIRRLVWCHMRLCQERDLGLNSIRRYLETGEYVNALGTTPAQKLIYMQDQIGSVRDIVDADTGARVGAYDYDPYGTTINEVGPANTSYRYGGLFWDGNIGQYLSVTRQYDPGTLRWLNRDFIREAGGTNMFAYVNGNPIMRTDPMGLCADWAVNDCIDPVYPELAIPVGGSLGAILRPVIGIILTKPQPPKLGDLTPGEISEIQKIVDEAGRPLEVGGSAAAGTRRCVGENLPIGKGSGTRSDIDYIAPPSSLPYFQGGMSRLPGLDPATGIIPGTGNPHIGPIIRFEPNAPPQFTPMPRGN